ncbi:MlaA family lipoprotein [Pukyongiella litopenaei]|uniref:VacJ family lipoprotein n=1 Tax=Pukyongiella litopenaei TaxID=2605946 RepID=A0A2S0MSL7_9RHOB|nr:VacJ family lipoprotein [Pukyongiella litopenaei]AVO38862.1 VacJ family lipoprotein [Pukyongiella litopenaei]
MNVNDCAAKAGIVIALSALLSGCATPTPEQVASGEPFDPYEKNNRAVHRFNVAVDRIFFRPAAKGYTNLIPDPIEDSFNYFSENLSKPGDTANFIAQGNFREAGISLARFLVNTTIGFAGLADPATEFGIPEAETDFGETLHVWGAPAGAYVELPGFGPSTQRDAIGLVADFFTNPLTFALQNPAENIGVYSNVVERLSDRGRYSDTVDAILYESADSYAVARVIYLENRRYELEGNDGDSYVDPYADTSGGGASDPYADIYEDPYAE